MSSTPPENIGGRWPGQECLRKRIKIVIKSGIMEEEARLKRNLFADHIRNQGRQRARKAIKDHFQHQLPPQEADPMFQIGHLAALHRACLQTNYAAQPIAEAVAYVTQNPSRCKYREASQFLLDLSRHVSQLRSQAGEGESCDRKGQCDGQCQACELFERRRQMFRVVGVLEQIFKWEQIVRESNPTANQQQDRQYEPMEECYFHLVGVCCTLEDYLPVWIWISQLYQDHRFLLAGLGKFETYVGDLLLIRGSLQREQFIIRSILVCIRQYLGCVDELDSEGRQIKRAVIELCLKMLDNIASVFVLDGEHAVEFLQLVDCVFRGSEGHEETYATIFYILQQTQIYIRVCEMLARKEERTTPIILDIVGGAAMFIGHMFSCSDEQLCNKVYSRNPLILKQLRSWLPAPSQVLRPMLDHPSSASSPYCNQCCSRNLLFALSNIVATSLAFVDQYLNCDIYLTLLLLYKTLPVTCREQISQCLYSMAYRGNAITIMKQVECRLSDVVLEMLQEREPTILRNAMGIIVIVLDTLPKVKPPTEPTYYVEPCLKFAGDLMKQGGRNLLESHLASKAEGVSSCASRALKALQECAG